MPGLLNPVTGGGAVAASAAAPTSVTVIMHRLRGLGSAEHNPGRSFDTDSGCRPLWLSTRRTISD